jgi:hypothetical protein
MKVSRVSKLFKATLDSQKTQIWVSQTHSKFLVFSLCAVLSSLWLSITLDALFSLYSQLCLFNSEMPLDSAWVHCPWIMCENHVKNTNLAFTRLILFLSHLSGDYSTSWKSRDLKIHCFILCAFLIILKRKVKLTLFIISWTEIKWIHYFLLLWFLK